MILDEICEHKRNEVAHQKNIISLNALLDVLVTTKAVTTSPARDFAARLRAPGMCLIAEVKKASPSRGLLFPDMDPAALSHEYEEAGADAISVLTDERYFQGSLENLRIVHNSVSLPCLRKDFIIDEYQIYEARVAQADAILLITRILSDMELHDFLQLAQSLGMVALVETNSEHEVDRALVQGAKIIGVNNRDLSTFHVDLETTLKLRHHVPSDVLLVAESGIHTREDVVRLEEAGVDAILVGESLVTSGNIRGKITELLAR